MSTGPTPGFHLIGVDELKRSWGWFLALGIVLIILGTIALGASVIVTFASMIFFGWLLILGGILTAGHAFWRRRWNGFFIDLLAGVLYALAGVMLVAHPGESAITLTLLMALFFLIGGIFRIVIALSVPYHNQGWLLLNGVVTSALGILIWRQWPLDGLWVIGLFVGIDMIFYGWSLVMLGLSAKTVPAPPV